LDNNMDAEEANEKEEDVDAVEYAQNYAMEVRY
jgi:hypothetical protein